MTTSSHRSVSLEACETPGQLLCRMTIPLRWSDMDAAGHVNNTVYFRLAEEVRLMWFTRMGFTGELGRAQGPVIMNASMTFLRQLHYPGTVSVSMTGADPGRSSFATHYVLADPDDPEQMYARGAARCVWMDYASVKSHPMPEPLRHAILNPAPMLLAP